MTSKKNVVGRLTAIRSVGVRTIIEVHEEATFSTFFHYYTQAGMKRSTKKLIRTANRNEGLHPWYAAYRMQPGLEALAEQLRKMPQFTSVKIRIIKKRAYRRLCTVAADVLGGLAANKPCGEWIGQRPIAVDLDRPQSFILVAKRSRSRLTYGIR